MSAEPSVATPDTKPSADSAEFEDFFEQGRQRAHEDSAVRAEQQQQAEDFDVPLITPEQLARRARLRRAVGLLVTGLGVAFLVLFISRGQRGSELVLEHTPVAMNEPAPLPAKAVATSLGAARPQPVAPTPPPAAEPAPQPEPLATPPAGTRVAGGVAPVALRTSGPKKLAAAPMVESPRRLAAAGPPSRTASAPVRGAPPEPRSSRAAEPPAIASFPVDPQ